MNVHASSVCVCSAVACETAWVVATACLVKVLMYLALAATLGLPPGLKYLSGTTHHVLGGTLCVFCWRTGEHLCHMID